jgi:ABC-2 type transport system ATP-binding protein
VIHLEGLRKSYGHISALQGVSLDVREGEVFGLLGPNGAGKSTLIKILVGSSRPSAGSVQVMGLNPVDNAADLRRQIGYMPQAAVLYEDLSARDNVRFFAQAHALTDLDRRVTEALELVGLQARANDAVYGLSGGMKQRVSLACALVHGPRLLLLDEPTAGVDPRLRETFWHHFRRLAENGATLLISTHQMDEAQLCDRLAILRDGVVLACDTPRDLLARGRATIRIHKGAEVETLHVANYADQLPQLLQHHSLDRAVTRIEIDQDTLETVVLELIRAREEQDVARH